MHLYLHIPFCRRACHYCDFHFSTSLGSKTDVVAAMVQEIAMQQDYLPSRQLQTIYFGGGTPSLLNINELYDIFKEIHARFEVASDAEITLEVNPDDVTKDRLTIWQRFGINRLSIGIQSFQDPYLQYLNRIHTADLAKAAVYEAQSAGITNLTIDLIYAINPNLRKPSKRKQLNERVNYTITELHHLWEDDLATALALQVPHISAYCLTIEERTVFGNWLKNNQIPPPDDAFAAKQFDTLVATLTKAGFEQYEISNFAQHGHYAVHNTSYWKGEPYLGVGPSAHSFNGHSRQFNVKNNAAYVSAIANGSIPFDREILTPENRANELIMTGLRTQWGVNIAEIANILPLSAEFRETVERLQAEELLVEEAGNLRLTKQAKFLADGIASDLFF